MPSVAYDPNNALQQNFLHSLAQGESGGSPFAATVGVGGVNLDGAPTDAYGFPQWHGYGNSHAAGIYQFEPATWDAEANAYGLNFANPADQNAGAWYLAQDTYARNTGGGDLTDALASGDYTSVQTALKGVWPSVVGNAASPQGLAASLASDTSSGTTSSTAGGSWPYGAFGLGTPDPSGNQNVPSEGGTGWFAAIENWLVRSWMIVIGIIVIALALWALLARSGVVPSPTDTAKDAAKAIAA